MIRGLTLCYIPLHIHQSSNSLAKIDATDFVRLRSYHVKVEMYSSRGNAAYKLASSHYRKMSATSQRMEGQARKFRLIRRRFDGASTTDAERPPSALTNIQSSVTDQERSSAFAPKNKNNGRKLF